MTSATNQQEFNLRDYWQILVLSAVRLGCDFDYDALQDLAEKRIVQAADDHAQHLGAIGDGEKAAVSIDRYLRRLDQKVGCGEISIRRS